MYAQSYEQVVMRDRPLQWFRITGPEATYNSGIRATDTYLAPVGAAVQGRAGLPGAASGGAIRISVTTQGWNATGFVSTYQHILHESAGGFGNNNGRQATFEVWIIPESVRSTSCFVFGRVNGIASNQRYFGGLYIESDGKAAFRFATNQSVVATIDLRINDWNHLVGVFDHTNTSRRSRLYVNGTVVVSAQASFGSTDHLDSATGYTCVSNNARTATDGTANLPFDGTIAEPAIYGYGLSPQQVLDHYQAGLGVQRRQPIHTAFSYPFVSEAPPPPGGLTAIGDVTNRRVALVSDRPR